MLSHKQTSASTAASTSVYWWFTLDIPPTHMTRTHIVTETGLSPQERRMGWEISGREGVSQHAAPLGRQVMTSKALPPSYALKKQHVVKVEKESGPEERRLLLITPHLPGHWVQHLFIRHFPVLPQVQIHFLSLISLTLGMFWKANHKKMKWCQSAFLADRIQKEQTKRDLHLLL